MVTCQFYKTHTLPQVGSKLLPGPVLLSPFTTQFEYSGWLVFKPEIAEADVINYLNPSIWTVNGGPAVGITYSDAGVDFFQLDWDGISPLTNANFKGLRAPCALNEWHYLAFGYVDNTMYMSLDGGPFQTLTGVTYGLFGWALLDTQWGLNGIAANLWEGKIAEVALSKTALSEDVLLDVYQYTRERYNYRGFSTIDLLTVSTRSPRRVRAVFTGTLGSGAFGIPAPSFYTLTSDDAVGIEPDIVGALVVPNSPNVVELALGEDLVSGGRYTLTASEVPDAGGNFTPTDAAEPFWFGTSFKRKNAEPFKEDQQRLLYGVDLIFSGEDYEETANGDLARVSGPANVTKALWHSIECDGLPWDGTWGAKAREFVDSPSAAAGTLRGSVSAQLLKDPRVKSIKTQLEIDEDKTFIHTVPTLITGEDIEPVSLSIPNGT